MLSFQSNTIKPINMKIGMYKYFLWRTFLYYPLCCRSPTGGVAAYPLLHRSTLKDGMYMYFLGEFVFVIHFVATPPGGAAA